MKTPLRSLRAQWNEFALDPEARLLVWLMQPGEESVIHAMLSVESDKHAASIPDLFIRIAAPLELSKDYANAVRDELLAQYFTSWDALADASRPARYDAVPGDLFATCKSFLSHHDEVFDHLVLVLTPAAVADEAAYTSWLTEAARRASPLPRMRLLVLLAGNEGEALAEAIKRQAGDLVRIVIPNLNIPAELEKLSREAGGLGSPGGRFRHLFVQLTNAIGAGDLAQAERIAIPALAITQAQSWPALAVAIHFALGGGLLAAGRPQDAIGRYQSAFSAARAATQAGAAEGGSLELRALLAVGSAQLRSGDYGAAAGTYEQAAPLATAQSDVRMQLECWRMASFCHEATGSPQRAWEHAQRALAVGHSMDAETRATSTLPYLGEALDRLSRENLPGFDPRQVARQMSELLGKQ